MAKSIQCPHCQKFTPAQYDECLGCHQPLSASTPEPAAETPVAPPTPVTCPKCHSPQLDSQRQGFGLGKAAVGGLLTGGVGLLAGFFNASKVKVTCVNCGHSWRAGQR